MNSDHIILATLLFSALVGISWACLRAPQPYAKLCFLMRLGLGLVFLTSGFAKIAHQAGVSLGSFIGPVTLEAMLAPHGLALLGRFVAWAQAIIGLCLLSSRLATLGAIMLVPMLMTIGVVTVALDFKGTPFVVLVMLVMNFLLLLGDWHKLKFIWAENSDALRKPTVTWQWRGADTVWTLGVIFVLAALVVFSLAPSYGKTTLRLGLLCVLISGLQRWRYKSVASSLHKKP